MTPTPTPAFIALQLRRLTAQEMQIRDGIAMLRQQQIEFRLNMSMANRWGVVAVISKSVLIPLHIVINAMKVTEAQDLLQALITATIGAIEASHGEYRIVTIKLILKSLGDVIKRELKSRQMDDYIPGVGVLIGLAQDSASLLQTAVRVSSGNSQMSDEDRTLARMVERTIDRASVALQELHAKEARLRRLVQPVASRPRLGPPRTRLP